MVTWRGRRFEDDVNCRSILALVAILTALVPTAGHAQPSITWTGGVVGGGWDTISRGMAELIREKSGFLVRVLQGGAAQNPVRVEKGDADIGMSMPPLLGAATRGEDPYGGRKMEHLRALAGNMSLNVFHLYVATDLSLANLTMDQIFRSRAPIRLAISRPGTADIWVLEKIMAYYGLCAADKRADCYKGWEMLGARFFRGTYNEQAAAFKGRRVDGTFAFLALPAAAITEASHGRRLTLLPFSQPLLDYLATFGLAAGVIPAGTYPLASNADSNVASATMGTTITISTRMSEDLAYLLTRTINDNVDRVRKMHESMADYDPSRGYVNLGVPLHPGAERYYREKGWLQ
jgi:TRAP transporter TAXI family solute receptor